MNKEKALKILNLNNDYTIRDLKRKYYTWINVIIKNVIIDKLNPNGIDWGGICGTYCNQIYLEYIEIKNLNFELKYNLKWGGILARFSKDCALYKIIINSDIVNIDGVGFVAEGSINTKQKFIYWNKGYKKNLYIKKTKKMKGSKKEIDFYNYSGFIPID